MRKNNGFTLIELLGVLIVLSIIAVIVYPVFSESITNSKNNLYNQQIETLKKAARSWGIENSKYIPDADMCAIRFSDLKKGFIEDKDVINPKTNKDLTGCMTVYWDESVSQLKYDYNETCKNGIITISNCVTEGEQN